MQVTMVMLMVLSGLGCHHKPSDATCVPAYCGTRSLYATEYATVVEPSCYNKCRGCGDGGVGVGCARDGWGPSSGGYIGYYAGGAVGCGCSRFPHH